MKILDLLNYMKINEMKMYELQIDSLDCDEEINFPNVRFFNSNSTCWFIILNIYTNKNKIKNTAYLVSIFLIFSNAWEILSLDAAKLNLT